MNSFDLEGSLDVDIESNVKKINKNNIVLI